MADRSPEIEDALTLRLCEGVGPTLYARLVEKFGTCTRALAADSGQLESIEGVGRVTAQRIAGSRRRVRDEAARALDRAEQLGLACLPINDPRYPATLRLIPDPPPVLFAMGTLSAEPEPAVGIVGSRKATAYGIEQAERFASILAQRHGLTIASGGARGIDTAAHRATLRARGRTVAVLGAGHAVPYPPENAGMYDEIAGTGGLVISEFPPDTPPARENFPGRNRLISGLSVGVLVIEAPKRSGALITARLAVDDQGREAMALPGRVDSDASVGSNGLIRSGYAAMVTSPAEVAEQLAEPAPMLLAAACEQMPSGAAEMRAVPHVSMSERTADAARDIDEPRAPGAETKPTQVQPLELPATVDAGGVKVNGSVAALSRQSAPTAHAGPPCDVSERSGSAQSGAGLFAGRGGGVTDRQERILAALDGPLGFDELVRRTGLDAAAVRSEATLLELRGLIVRTGTALSRR